MEHMLQDLWDSYYAERFSGMNEEEKLLVAELADKEQALMATLNADGAAHFKVYDACVGALSAVAEREAFIAGVRFATAFLHDAMTFDRR